MAESNIEAWTISAGAVGKKPGKRSYGGPHSAMSISTSRRHTMLNWQDQPAAGKNRTVWNGVISALVGAE